MPTPFHGEWRDHLSEHTGQTSGTYLDTAEEHRVAFPRARRETVELEPIGLAWESGTLGSLKGL